MKHFLLEFFNFSRRESRSLVILILILAVITLLRLFLPYLFHPGIINDPELIADTQQFISSLKIYADTPDISEELNSQSTVKPKFNYFDPNIVSREELIQMGFSEFATSNLLKYRSKGGRFTSKTDLLNIYGIDTSLVKDVFRWIVIEDNNKQDKPAMIQDSVETKLFFININNCTEEDLIEELKIKNYLASRILKYRDLLNGFYSIDQLGEVYGLTDSMLNDFSQHIIIDTSMIKKLSIGTAEFSELLRHPYIEKNDVESIFLYRKYCNGSVNLSEFFNMEILRDSVIDKIRPYVKE